MDCERTSPRRILVQEDLVNTGSTKAALFARGSNPVASTWIYVYAGVSTLLLFGLARLIYGRNPTAGTKVATKQVVGIIVTLFVSWLVVRDNNLPLQWSPLLFAGIILNVPLFYCLNVCVRNSLHTISEKVSFTPVENIDLPQAVRGYFETNSTVFARLGFTKIGDFRMKDSNTRYARFFLSSDGKMFGEIAYASIFMTKIKCCCFFSLTDSNVYVETGGRAVGNKKHQLHNFRLGGKNTGDVVEILSLHEDALAEPDIGSPRRLTAEQLEDVVMYGQQRLYELMILEGNCKENPYDDLEFDWDSHEQREPVLV